MLLYLSILKGFWLNEWDGDLERRMVFRLKKCECESERLKILDYLFTINFPFAAFRFFHFFNVFFFCLFFFFAKLIKNKYWVFIGFSLSSLQTWRLKFEVSHYLLDIIFKISTKIFFRLLSNIVSNSIRAYENFSRTLK